VSKNFIIVGAQRSGTTYLYQLLDEHPEICMNKPFGPEPKYFLNKSLEEVNIASYENIFFNSCDSCSVKGEKSTSYYENEDSARLIASSMPHAQIIFFLRNPGHRALSNYFFSVNSRLETRSIKEVFVENKDAPCLKNHTVSVSPFNYLGRGEYINHIEMYLKHFPRDKIKVIILEELVGSMTHIQDVFSFLGVRTDFSPEGYRKVVNQSIQDQKVPEEISLFLSSYYKKSIASLETILMRDLSIWR